ncbi:HET-domain-containing protein [Lindgomyces ingoldianus]|uniref:HET-domain-containing protein n=1 Tax=Lindgomyces ingoldianus TaxID=673940 RepID=A0ACB6QSP0_9PLEO|nr:HET-domain-containing protein [Lindgomyces ingoldianus]KAF2469583.1 HET-domain-containing protein [Lindgomyces ingoldianus]
MEWQLLFEEELKGYIVRNSRKKLKENNIEPRMIWDDTVAPPSIVQMWIGQCTKVHQDCRPAALDRIRYDKGENLKALMPNILFIDVVDDRIVEGNLHVKYAALSYVWGGVTQELALRDNIQSLKKKRALRSPFLKIPQLVRDAMAFAYSINIRYLWVDALCIIQDDSSKHDTLTRMDMIYNLAHLTIVAIDSTSANSQLPGVERQSRYHPHPELKTKADWFHTRPSTNVDSHIKSTVYSSRAWTFQEELLSTRCLYMTKTQMFFRCRTAVWAETAPVKNLGQQADPCRRMWGNLHGADRVQAYREVLCNYTERKLSCSTDVLDAFAGVTASLSNDTDWQFVDGMLLQHLPSELLFIHEGEHARRLGPDGRPCFPSWAWAGWTGRVTWARSDTDSSSGDEDGVLEILSKDHGPPMMNDIAISLTDAALARVQAQTFRRRRDSISITPNAPKVQLQLQPDPSQQRTLLCFQSHLISANDLEFSVREKCHVLSNSRPTGITYDLHSGGRWVGILFSHGEEWIQSVRHQGKTIWFVQITERGALMIQTRSGDGYSERVGVAFFGENIFGYSLTQTVVLI